ncbi:MAG: DNA primase [Myxococcota bacterium]
MARIPREIVDQVRERTDIGEIIGRHVALTRRGRNLVGLCPFHQEKSPSFNVIQDKGIYHCFGCQAGGDVFRFLMTLEGLSFVEAVKELAEPVGITIEERELSPAERKQLRQRASAFDVLEASAAFYEAQLWTGPAGAAGRAYLANRAMTDAQARTARLGWAPGGWTRLVDHLHREGYDAEQVAEAGVARLRSQGEGYYDTLRERLVIPIRDERGRVIAFGGRLLEGEGPKYLNTPETRLYEKSHVLYGLDSARLQIQKAGRVLVVEGYFDVLSLHQAGFGEAVATCGTALTPTHLEKLRRLARDVVLVMDADEAGLKAAQRSLPLFVEAQVQPWRIELPGGKDPDECLRVEGAEAFHRALANKEPLLEWVMRRKLEQYGDGAMSRDRLLDEVVPMLARLRDSSLARDVARKIGLAEDDLLRRLRDHGRAESSRAAAAERTASGAGDAASEDPAPPPEPAWKPTQDIVHLVWLVVHRYDQVADLIARLDPSLLDGHGPIRPAFARLVSGEPVATVIEDSGDPMVQKLLRAIVARDRLYEPEEAAAAVLQIVDRLIRPRWTHRLVQLKHEIERAETAGQTDRLMAALREKQDLHARERKLDTAVKRGDVDAGVALLAGSPPPVDEGHDGPRGPG